MLYRKRKYFSSTPLNLDNYKIYSVKILGEQYCIGRENIPVPHQWPPPFFSLSPCIKINHSDLGASVLSTA